MGNLWFFSGILSQVMRKDPVSDALQRTTTAPTILRAGFKDNGVLLSNQRINLEMALHIYSLSVIPASAKAYVNHRIHPSDDIASVIYHDRAVIGDFNYKYSGFTKITKMYLTLSPI